MKSLLKVANLNTNDDVISVREVVVIMKVL